MQSLKIVLVDAGWREWWTFAIPEAISRKFRWSFTWRRLVILPIVWKVFHRPHYVIKQCNEENEKANFPTLDRLASNTTPSLISYPSKRLLPRLTSGKNIAGSNFAGERWTCAVTRREMEDLLQYGKPASHGRWVSCKSFRSFCKVPKKLLTVGFAYVFLFADLKAFERRLTEYVSCLGPQTGRWRR